MATKVQEKMSMSVPFDLLDLHLLTNIVSSSSPLPINWRKCEYTTLMNSSKHNFLNVLYALHSISIYSIYIKSFRELNNLIQVLSV